MVPPVLTVNLLAELVWNCRKLPLKLLGAFIPIYAPLVGLLTGLAPIKRDTVGLVELASAETCRGASGVEVPMPTLPLAKIVNKDEPVEETTVKGFAPMLPWTYKVEATTVVPMPTLPLCVELRKS